MVGERFSSELNKSEKGEAHTKDRQADRIW